MDKEALKAYFDKVAAAQERDYQYKVARQADIIARLEALEAHYGFDLDAYSDIYGITGLDEQLQVASGIIDKWARLFDAMQYPNATLVAFADRKNPDYYDGNRYEKTFVTFGVIAHGDLRVESRETAEAETGKTHKELVLCGGQILAFDGLDIEEVQEYVLASSKTTYDSERPDVLSTVGKVLCEGSDGAPSKDFLAQLHNQGIRGQRAFTAIYHLQQGRSLSGAVNVS